MDSNKMANIRFNLYSGDHFYFQFGKERSKPILCMLLIKKGLRNSGFVYFMLGMVG